MQVTDLYSPWLRGVNPYGIYQQNRRMQQRKQEEANQRHQEMIEGGYTAVEKGQGDVTVGGRSYKKPVFSTKKIPGQKGVALMHGNKFLGTYKPETGAYKVGEIKSLKVDDAATGKPIWLTVIYTGKKTDNLYGMEGWKKVSEGTCRRPPSTTVNVGPKGLQKETVKKLEQKIMADDQQLANLKDIITLAKPEYQEIPTRFGYAVDAIKEKWKLGTPPTAEQKKALGKYTQYRKAAVRDFGIAIQELGKGNLTRHERELYRKGLPDPGTKWYDGDSWTEFSSAMKVTYKRLLLSRARTQYYLSLNYDQKAISGLLSTGGIMSMEKFEQVVEQKAAEYAAELKRSNPNIQPQQMREMLKQFMVNKFGFDL